MLLNLNRLIPDQQTNILNLCYTYKLKIILKLEVTPELRDKFKIEEYLLK